jgi:hypothetical protein
MSLGLPHYPNPERPDQVVAEEGKAVASARRFTAFLLINLAAAYAPALFWVPLLPGIEYSLGLLLFSPVVFGANDPFTAWAVLLLRPEMGSVIKGSGGLRKLRSSLKGTGKRGGLRVIYYWHEAGETFYMLYAFRKSRREDLTAKQLKALILLVREEFQ